MKTKVVCVAEILRNLAMLYSVSSAHKYKVSLR